MINLGFTGCERGGGWGGGNGRILGGYWVF